MRIFAYCAKSYEESTRRAAGRQPLTCPPVSAEWFPVVLLEDCDLLYFDLHGQAYTQCWYGDNGIVALRDDQIRQANLGGAVVFVVNCYLADDESPMLDALLDAGAGYVIGGEGANFAGQTTPQGAALLGLWVRRLMAVGLPPLRALGWAKQRVRVSKTPRKADALAFTAYYRERANA